MTDQTIPADKVRDLIRQYRKMIEDDGTHQTQAMYNPVVSDLEAILPTPPRPTLATMTPDEREACVGMQADVEMHDGSVARAAIVDPNDFSVALVTPGWERFPRRLGFVTPRPDLPRLTWPGSEPVSDTPASINDALPEGWRLADHPAYGRVIVTLDDGENAVVICPGSVNGMRVHHSEPNALAFVGTTPAPNRLAVGSQWDDKDDLTRAAIDFGGSVTVVNSHGAPAIKPAGATSEFSWLGPGAAGRGDLWGIFAPWTVVHTGREADHTGREADQ